MLKRQPLAVALVRAAVVVMLPKPVPLAAHVAPASDSRAQATHCVPIALDPVELADLNHRAAIPMLATLRTRAVHVAPAAPQDAMNSGHGVTPSLRFFRATMNVPISARTAPPKR